MSDDLVTWLRKQIRLRLTLATVVPLLDQQGNSPRPPDPAYLQYVDDVPWHYFTRDSLVRHLATSGVLTEADPARPSFEDWPMDSLTPLMAPADPRDAAARCMAELAILDELKAAQSRRDAEQNDYGDWVRGEATGPRPGFAGPDPRLIVGLERAVRLLGQGYRSRPGYREEWKP